MPRKKKTTIQSVPKVIRGTITDKDGFIVPHYSYSSLVLFTSNPLMFKIRYINHDKIETTSGPNSVLGRAFHYAMQLYWTQPDETAVGDGLVGGMKFIDEYPEGWIGWTKTITNKQKVQEMFAFAYNSYVKEKPRSKNTHTILETELEVNVPVEITWREQHLALPVPLKGIMDKVTRDAEGRLIITDYKTTSSFSDPDKIDGEKIIQAIQYYFLVYAYYGEEPHKIIYEEVKVTKNQDNSPQMREYEIVYNQNDLFFDFYIRLYGDITRALSGEQVFVPNVKAMYDNEVSILSYVHRLDMSEEQAALMKKHKVDNLTSLLKQKMQTAGNMAKLMKTAEKEFISSENLNYTNMTPEQKISTKLMEHGMMIQFHSKIDGATVKLYQYTPSIGLKMSQLKKFAPDIEQVLGISGIRILAPIPNSTMVGFEVPKAERYFPALPTDKEGTFDIAIGETIMGETRRFDIREAPHMLVAGASGSGKSYFLSSVITQLNKIPNVDLHLYDPKRVELAMFQDLDNTEEYHHDIMQTYASLKELVMLMNMRYDFMAKKKVRNISETDMRYKFVIIDEFGDYVAAKHIVKIDNEKVNISDEIQRLILILAQKARAAGIHLILATQRPSTDTVSGSIKANFPCKVVFRVAKEVDSRVVLDESGAEKLMGKGDCLFATAGMIERLQGYSM